MSQFDDAGLRKLPIFRFVNDGVEGRSMAVVVLKVSCPEVRVCGRVPVIVYTAMVLTRVVERVMAMPELKGLSLCWSVKLTVIMK